MILLDRNPQYTLYYVGAKVFKVLKSNKEEYIPEKLYEYLKDNDFKGYGFFSFRNFIFALDWLFLIQMISIDDNGFVKCI